MQVKVNRLSETKVKLDITLSASELKNAESIALVKIAKDVKVPGFRNGTAPASMIKKYASQKDLEENIIDSAIIVAITGAYKDNSLQPIDRPSIEVKKYIPGDTLEFTAESEVMPNIDLADYKSLNAKKGAQKVTKTEIDDVLNRIRQNYKELKPVDRPVKNEDEVIIDFIGKKDGVPFNGGDGKDYHLNIGAGQFIEGFEAGIIGHKKGDNFDLNLKFPENYPEKTLAGQEVVFSVSLKEINEVILPELNDELAKKIGQFKSMADLNKDIEVELQNQKNISVENEYKDNLVKEAVKKSKLVAPDVMIDDQIKLIQNDIQQNIAYQGLNRESYISSRGYKDEQEWLEKEVRPLAIDRVKAGLVLSKIAETEKISASDNEVESKINELKVRYGKNSGILSQLKSPTVRQEISNRIVTEKTIDKLVELNK